MIITSAEYEEIVYIFNYIISKLSYHNNLLDFKYFDFLKHYFIFYENPNIDNCGNLIEKTPLPLFRSISPFFSIDYLYILFEHLYNIKLTKNSYIKLTDEIIIKIINITEDLLKKIDLENLVNQDYKMIYNIILSRKHDKRYYCTNKSFVEALSHTKLVNYIKFNKYLQCTYHNKFHYSYIYKIDGYELFYLLSFLNIILKESLHYKKYNKIIYLSARNVFNIFIYLVPFNFDWLIKNKSSPYNLLNRYQYLYSLIYNIYDIKNYLNDYLEVNMMNEIYHYFTTLNNDNIILSNNRILEKIFYFYNTLQPIVKLEFSKYLIIRRECLYEKIKYFIQRIDDYYEYIDFLCISYKRERPNSKYYPEMKKNLEMLHEYLKNNKKEFIIIKKLYL